MTTRGVREGCAYLKGGMLLSSYGGSSLHEPTQPAEHIRTSIEPRNLLFESTSPFFFVSAREGWMDAEGEKRKAERASDV